MAFQRKLTALLGVPVLALSLAGCSNAASASAGTTADQPSGDDGQISVWSGRDRMPLNEALGGALNVGTTPAEHRAIIEAREIHREELIAQCMADLGFEYQLYLDESMLPVGEGEPWLRDDSDWVARYGYGNLREDVEPGSVPSTSRSWGQHNTDTDPNREHFYSLSAAEQAAWNLALWGPPFSWGGCAGQAEQQSQDEQRGGFNLLLTDEFMPLFTAINEMWSDQWFEITEADQDWAHCMADAGYPDFDQQWQAQASIGAPRVSVPGQAVMVFGIDDEELAELRVQEISLALADLNCRNQTDFAARRRVFEREIEIQFVNDHRLAIAAFNDAVAQRGLAWED